MLTRHAQARCRQRAIPPVVIDLILQFGRIERAHRADRMYLDKRGRRRAMAYLGNAARLYDKHLGAFIVVGDNGRIITAGHRS